MPTYKRDFSKKIKRNIRKNIKTRKTRKTRKTYKKRRNSNKTKKVGGWPSFSLTSNSSDSSKSNSTISSTNSSYSNNTTDDNIIIRNMKEPFVIKGDMVRLIKKGKKYNKYGYLESDLACKKMSSSSKKECETYRIQLYGKKYTDVYAYDRGDDTNNFSLKVYLPEDKNYTAYPDTVTVSAADFDIIPIQYISGPDNVKQLIRTNDQKIQILKNNKNANLMSEQKV